MPMRANQPFMLNAQHLWAQVESLYQELGSTAQNEVYQLASFYTPHMYKGIKSGILPLFWELRSPDMAPPRSIKECRLYSLSIATGLQFVIKEYLGTTFSMLKKALEEKIPSSLPQNLERDERLLRKYNEPVDRWLNTRLRTYTGSLVDLYFRGYKRYHPLPAFKQEILLERLERAGVKATLQSLLGITSSEKMLSSFFPDFLQQFEGSLEMVSSRFDFPDSPSVDGFVSFSFVLIELLAQFAVRMSEQMANPHSELRERVEEGIRSSIRDECKRLVSEMERYEPHFDARRLSDYDILIVHFDPLDALCFEIIREHKQKRHTEHRCSVRELAQGSGIDAEVVYNFTRRLKYLTQVDLLRS